jgi:hypothetical protein
VTTVFRLDLATGELHDRRRTPHGGLIARAHLTRVGVFQYTMPDGTSRRELRHPEDVFSADSLATYPHAPVTVDHPGRVDTKNWRDHAVGHVAGPVKREGDFVSGELTVEDSDAIARAESGKLQEISCGYQCGIDPTPGTYDGQEYDVRQKDIRINHVAMGPSGWGRMGPEVRLRLDGGSAVSGLVAGVHYVRADSSSPEGQPMTDDEKKALEKAQADADQANKDLEKARADAKDAKNEAEKLAAKTREDAATIAKLTAEKEVLKLQVSRETTDQRASEAAAATEKLVEETIQLRSDARELVGADWKYAGKSNDQVRREVIKALEPDMKADALEGPALVAVYDLAVSHARKVAGANAHLRTTVTGPLDTSDAAGGDAAKARAAMIAKKTDAWKKKPSRIDRSKGAK